MDINDKIKSILDKYSYINIDKNKYNKIILNIIKDNNTDMLKILEKELDYLVRENLNNNPTNVIINYINKYFGSDYLKNIILLDNFLKKYKCILSDNDIVILLENDIFKRNILYVSKSRNDIDFINNVIRVYEVNKIDSYQEELIKLINEYKKGNYTVSEEIMKKNFPLVFHIALKYKNKHIELQDLIQEGFIGIIYALEKYDSTKGKFSTYATYWIRQNMQRTIENQSRNIRISAHRNELILQVKKAINNLEHELNKTPNSKEIAKYLQINETVVTETLKVINDTVSLDSTLVYDNKYLYEIIEDEFQVEEYIIKKDLIQNIYNAIEMLNYNERKVIELYFGLKGTNYTLHEIGEILGVSTSRIGIIKLKGLEKIKYYLEHEQLKSLPKKL